MLTVACVWVKGNVDYSPEYVTNLRAMVAKHLPVKHRFVCLTDRPEALRDITCVRITPDPGIPGWWAKRHLFDAGLYDQGTRVLSIDLDVLIVDDLRPIAHFPTPFALLPSEGNFAGGRGLEVRNVFNSSVMVFDAGVATDIVDEWTPEVGKWLWGDQDWIADLHPEAATMPLEWFPRLSQRPGQQAWTEAAKIVLCKKPKNHVAAQQSEWFRNAWEAR